MTPDKKYREKVRVRTAIPDGFIINVSAQMNRYAHISPIRPWTDPIPIGEYTHIKLFVKMNVSDVTITKWYFINVPSFI